MKNMIKMRVAVVGTGLWANLVMVTDTLVLTAKNNYPIVLLIAFTLAKSQIVSVSVTSVTTSLA